MPRPIGDGGYDLGARAQQIRDRLKATPRFDEKSLGAIHFDDEALFLRPWAGRIAASAPSPTARPEVTRLLDDWNGRADADQAGYRLVREVRTPRAGRVVGGLERAAGPGRPVPGRATYDWHARFEYAGRGRARQAARRTCCRAASRAGTRSCWPRSTPPWPT